MGISLYFYRFDIDFISAPFVNVTQWKFDSEYWHIVSLLLLKDIL